MLFCQWNTKEEIFSIQWQIIVTQHTDIVTIQNWLKFCELVLKVLSEATFSTDVALLGNTAGDLTCCKLKWWICGMKNDIWKLRQMRIFSVLLLCVLLCVLLAHCVCTDTLLFRYVLISLSSAALFPDLLRKPGQIYCWTAWRQLC